MFSVRSLTVPLGRAAAAHPLGNRALMVRTGAPTPLPSAPVGRTVADDSHVRDVGQDPPMTSGFPRTPSTFSSASGSRMTLTADSSTTGVLSTMSMPYASATGFTRLHMVAGMFRAPSYG